jgi:hypothetical protein
MIAGLGANIVNRESLSSLTVVIRMSLEASIKQVETDLRTTSGKISLSLSLFIVVLGGVPLLWTAISEIKGRKVRVHCIRHLSCLPRGYLDALPLQARLHRLFRDWYGGVYSRCSG